MVNEAASAPLRAVCHGVIRSLSLDPSAVTAVGVPGVFSAPEYCPYICILCHGADSVGDGCRKCAKHRWFIDLEDSNGDIDGSRRSLVPLETLTRYGVGFSLIFKVQWFRVV